MPWSAATGRGLRAGCAALGQGKRKPLCAFLAGAKAYLEPDEIARLEKAATNLRDRLLIRLLSRLGCRVSEAVALTVQDIEDMLRALKQVGGVAKEVSGIVRLRWEAETLAVSARAEEVGETAVEIAAQATGPGRTALKFNYLMEYFSSRAGSVTLATASPSAPVTFTHRGTLHVVVMPMHVKD